MTLLRIAQLGEPVLRQRARPLSIEELKGASIQQLIDDMVDTMRDADGAGIAAPQVYQSVRVCVMELADNPRYPGHAMPLTVLVNPVVEALTSPELPDHEAIEMYEGCLSVHGLRGRVRRPRHVRFTALARDGTPFGGELQGIGAAVIQHETDHLDGVLFVDRADPRSLCFLREFGRHVPPQARFRDGGAG